MSNFIHVGNIAEAAPGYVAGILDDIRKGQKKLVSRRELEAEADESKADLRYIKKVARLGLEEIDRVLKPRGQLVIPKEKYLEFMESFTDSFYRAMSERKSRWPGTKLQVFDALAGPHRVKQAENHKRTYSPDALGLGVKLQAAIRGKSNTQLVLAAVKSGFLADYQLGRLANQVKATKDGDPKVLRALLKALKAV